MIGCGSAADPFPMMWEYPIQTGANGIGNSITAGRTPQSSIISAPATTKTVLIGGQSNMATAPGTTVYTTLQVQSGNLNPYDGAIYPCSDPILGASNATITTGPSSLCARLMDRIISQGKATRAIGVPFAMGGTPFASWVPGNSDKLFSRIQVSILRARAKGLEPDCFIWGEGETDNQNGTSAASVTASINAIVDGIRAMNCIAPFYIGKYTMLSGTVSSTIQTGIANSITGATGRNIFAGYDADTNCTVAGGFRLADGTHMSNAGLDAAAIGWQGIIFP